jgi:hypothetical protein
MPNDPDNPLLMLDDKMLLVGGKLVTSPEECCCGPEPGEDCEFCDSTPKYWTVTLSGFDDSICDDCYLVDDDPTESWKMSSIFVPPLELDGVYRLFQGATSDPWTRDNPCRWKSELLTVFSQSRVFFDTTDCTGSHELGTNYLWHMFLERTEAGWEAWITAGSSSTPLNITIRCFHGQSVETEDGNCLSIAPMENLDTTCTWSSSGQQILCIGGTITFEAGDQT